MYRRKAPEVVQTAGVNRVLLSVVLDDAFFCLIKSSCSSSVVVVMMVGGDLGG